MREEGQGVLTGREKLRVAVLSVGVLVALLMGLWIVIEAAS